jgi:hypothetical protein
MVSTVMSVGNRHQTEIAMSSTAYLTFVKPVAIDDWMAFCVANEIVYRPNVYGQSTFQSASTQISTSPNGSVQTDVDGRPDWSTARPPAQITKMDVGTFFMGDLTSVGDVLQKIADAFPCTVSSAPELAHLLVKVPQTHEIDELNDFMSTDFMSTDFVAGWAFADGVYNATVEAGDAMVSQDGELWKVEISGVDRGRFIDLNHAFAFASRADWNWWGGLRPAEQTETLALPTI